MEQSKSHIFCFAGPEKSRRDLFRAYLTYTGRLRITAEPWNMKTNLATLGQLLMFPVLVWLAGCATRIPIGEQARLDSFQANRAKLAALVSWRLQGRIALTMEHEAWSATLQWIQTGAEYELRVIAPLGRASFELRGSEQGVILRLAHDQILQAVNPETLLQDNFGWAVPVSGLHYWIRGIPDPDARLTRLELDESGRISALVQSGWQVSYTQYSNQGEFDLPGRIALDNGKMKLRLLIRSWNI